MILGSELSVSTATVFGNVCVGLYQIPCLIVNNTLVIKIIPEFFTDFSLPSRLIYMYEFALPRVLDIYGIKYRHIFESQKGYRNEVWPILKVDGRMLNVTFFKREPRIINRINCADVASEYLASLGMPTRQRADQRILQLKSGDMVTNIGIYNYLPGKTIPWEAYTMLYIKLLGKTMSNMHANLSTMPHDNFPSVYDEYLQIITRMKLYFSELTTREAIEQKLHIKINLKRLNIYEKLLRKYQTLPGQQVLHMDFVRGNILFDNHSISGILDFEKTSVGHTVVDIARTLAFLLVDCKYKSTDKVYKYFLYSGYKKRGKNKDINYSVGLNQFIEMFLFYDFYKFLLHNPYESLYLNEHYVRTRDILVKSDVILYK
jgi:Ser/Thr protein kinase RdoA (MazF antagonist)